MGAQIPRSRPGGSGRSVVRTHRCPRPTAAVVEDKVVELRRTARRGQDWIGPELGVPARTVSVILRRHRMPYPRDCDPLTGVVIRASKTTAVRYERDHPGELIHMDVNKIGRIPDGGGWKAHGRAAGDTWAHKTARTGYDYVHSAVDDHSRSAYSEILPDEKGTTRAGFLERAAQYFATRGLTAVEEVITDNHFSCRRSAAVATVIKGLGAIHRFIRPDCSWQNGKVERYNRTLQNEWAYRQVFTTNDARSRALAPRLEHYNNQRRHSAIGDHPPDQQTVTNLTAEYT